MTEVFEHPYASAYDALYADKDYASECDLIEQLAREYAAAPVHRVLDIGCGTGNHAWELAARGYEVTGVDRSSAMLARAREKTPAGRSVEFVESSIEGLALSQTFDMAVMMFAVVGYLLTDEQVREALHAVRRHLEPEGLFAFDCWYGPAVIAEGPSHRTKTVSTPTGRIVRNATGTLHPERDTCDVGYLLERYEADTLVEEIEERHTMRYFDEPTLRRLLEETGFELVRLGGFPDIEVAPDVTTWNVTGVARAVDSVG